MRREHHPGGGEDDDAKRKIEVEPERARRPENLDADASRRRRPNEIAGIASAVQAIADRKNNLGRGKKETNIGYPLSRFRGFADFLGNTVYAASGRNTIGRR
jgi:hypothetical protein